VCLDDSPLIPDIPVLHRDDDCVVVDKPPGILVHRSRESTDRVFVLQLVRAIVGEHVYPVHRLDRPASGVLLFALRRESARRLQEAMRAEDATKEYVVLVRGETQKSFCSDRPLTSRRGVPQPARTDFERIAAFDGCSLLRVRLRTGRFHQIRRHLAHLAHHVVGDTMHGKGRINRPLREQYGLPRLFLHAARLECAHPGGGRLAVRAPLAPDLRAFLERLPACTAETIAQVC
jgi:tRNA pseudouridine65 synthase